MNTELMFSSKSDLWETPQDLFDKLNAEFRFTLDGAGRAVPALGGHRVVQSTLWQGRGCLGTKSRSERLGWGHSGYAAASEDGYQMVPQVDLPPG